MWNAIIVDPMTNALLYIYSIVGLNFGLAIILFTIIVRLATYPLTAKQMKSTQGLQELQKSDKWQKMQEKYKNDREKLAQEQMKLYQEAGINPFGSCLPTVIQFPIIIGLYQAIIAALAATPVQLVEFSSHIYSFLPNLQNLVPLKSSFLWMDLSQPERLSIPGIPFEIPLLAILVVITSFLQSRLMTPTSGGAGDQNAMMGRMMSIYFPLFIGWLSYTFPAGLAIYFVASNIVGIVQYAAMGKLDWKNLLPGGREDTSESQTRSASKPPVKTTAKTGQNRKSKSGASKGSQKPKPKQNRNKAGTR